MENNWLNPLSPDVSNLISLSTSTVAPSEVVKDLPRALEVGEEAYQTFEGTGLDDDPPSVKFHDKMAKQRLKMFSTISTKTSRMKGQNVVLKANRNLFSQMILVADCISVNMEMQMGPYEKQTNLPRNLRKQLSPVEAIRTPSTCIIDCMGLVQRMNGNYTTLAQLAESVLSIVLYVGV